MPNAQELYTQNVRHLPPHERLRLAALILDELAHTAHALDFSTEWSDQDQQDLTRFALAYASTDEDEQQVES